MSTEQTEPSSHYGDDGHGAGSNAAPAQAAGENGTQAAGGSNSGRRRRRRRKNKSAGQPPTGEARVEGRAELPADESAASPAAPPAAAGTGSHQPAAPQSANHGQGKRKNGRKRAGGGGSTNTGGGSNGGGSNGGGSNGGGSNGGGSNGGQQSQPGNQGQNRSRGARQSTGGAWKARSEGPDGNREGARGGFGTEPFQDANGNGGGRRKGGGKFGRRGPTSFVGPMDHSYRMVNGNIADGSPSTMDYRSANGNANGNISGRNESSDPDAPAAARENAAPRILCFIEDLFVVAKMQETARKLGVKVQFLKAEKETVATITETTEAERPSLIVFDLNNLSAKPLTLIPKLKAKLKRGTSIIGFLQHIQGDLKLKAIEAGCDSVMPKAAFSQNLPNLLRRHGFAEEEEMVEA